MKEELEKLNKRLDDIESTLDVIRQQLCPVNEVAMDELFRAVNGDAKLFRKIWNARNKPKKGEV